jgi:hypothetical protein
VANLGGEKSQQDNQKKLKKGANKCRKERKNNKRK